MQYNGGSEIKVRVRGVDKYIRDLVRTKETLRESARRGCLEAAKFLMESIQYKFGKYQQTGGTGGGAWAKLKPDTVFKKARKYGSSVANKPLIGTGSMRDSFYVKGATTSKGIAASVASNDPKLPYHVYGAPRAGLPPRDTMLVTAIEVQDICHDIIEDEVLKDMGGM